MEDEEILKNIKEKNIEKTNKIIEYLEKRCRLINRSLYGLSIIPIVFGAYLLIQGVDFLPNKYISEIKEAKNAEIEFGIDVILRYLGVGILVGTKKGRDKLQESITNKAVKKALEEITSDPELNSQFN